MELVDIHEWASDEVKTISISLKLLHAPYEAKVRKFIPQEGDMLAEQWVRDGETVYYELPHYALANMEETALAIKNTVEKNAASYICNFIGNSYTEGDYLIWETYRSAFKRVKSAPVVNSASLYWPRFLHYTKIHC